MAPARGAKRGAKDAAAVAKKPRQDPNLKGIVEAMAMADLNDSCKAMLLASLPLALGTPADVRQECQHAVVRMVGEVLAGIEGKLEATLAAQTAEAKAIEGSESALAAQAAAAEAASVTAREHTQMRTTELAEVAKAARAAKAEVEEATEAQKRGDAESVKHKTQLASFEEGLRNNFTALSEGDSESGQAHYRALQPLMVDVQLEESLASALPAASQKKSDERTSFDIMVIDALGKCLKEKVAALSALVAEAAPAVETRAAALRAAQDAVEAQAAAQREAAARLTEAQAAQRDAAEAAQRAKEALADRAPQMEAAAKLRDDAADELENFKLYNVACFEVMRDAQTPKLVEKPIEEVPEERASAPIAAAGA